MNNRKAFTIVELLTSITIIALLIGILLPSIYMVRKMAKETAQKAQFATMDMAMDAFKQDYGDYPPSDQFEGIGQPGGNVYCGAQKLTEALLGWDLMGFHPKTAWRRDGFDNTTGAFANSWSYDPLKQRIKPDGQYYTLFERRGPYLDASKTNVFRLGNSAGNNDGLYDSAGAVFSAIFDAARANFVICDVFGVKKLSIPTSGTATITAMAGSPILYYKAKTSSKSCYCVPPPTVDDSIYNYNDNRPLLTLGVIPSGKTHKLMTPQTYFCDPAYKIVDEKVPPFPDGSRWPNRPDTYILISAGADHEFGTNDDILNF
jgi:type II secretory pathway pseudopilin PulG